MLRRVLAIFCFITSVNFLSAATKPNIILITIDSARADRMGFLGGKLALTPNLDQLARQSLIFEQAYAQAPTTVVSHATILTGTYPQTHQASEFAAPLSASLPYLPDLLRARGYRTAAFVQSTALDPRNGLAPGFDRGFTSYSVISSRTELAARAGKWLDQSPDVPSLQVISFALANVYYQPSLHAVDDAIGEFIKGLQKRKLFDDALIVVTAAHGTGLRSHGEDYSGIFLYDETIRVPLLVKLPQNQDAGKRVRAKVPLVNIAPTILEISGTPVPSKMQGQSLMRIAKGTTAEQPIYSRSDFTAQAFGLSPLESWRAGKFLYIRAPKPELYDLSTDPGATRNLAQNSKATLDTMASQLAAFDQRFTAGGNQQGQLTSSEMQKLASLGYVGLQKSGAVANATVSGTDPKDAIAVANKVSTAAALLEDGKPDKAQAILQPLLSAASSMYLAQYVMGNALAQQQKHSQAVQYLHRAIELQPDSIPAHYQMGRALLETGDYKTAAVHLEIVTERFPGSTTAHASLAHAYEHMGRTEDAKREKSKAAQP